LFIRYNGYMNNFVSELSPHDVERVFEQINAALALVDCQGRLLAWNTSFSACTSEHSTSENLDLFFPEAERPDLHTRLSSNSVEQWTGVFHARGEAAAVAFTFRLIPVSGGRAVFIAERVVSDSVLQGFYEYLNDQIGNLRIDVEKYKKVIHAKEVELQAVITQSKEVSDMDALTYLFNRRATIRELQAEVLRAVRYSSSLSVSIIDVDHFKAINDSYGHPVGDKVLQQVAAQLRDGIRTPDIIGRYGGEEFIIILPNSGVDAAGEQAARLCKIISANPLHIKEHAIPVTISVGVAELRIGQDTWDTLLNRADDAMYNAKKRGRNCWVQAE